MDAEQTYVLLGRLLENAPNLHDHETITPDERRWMARVCALAQSSGQLSEAAKLHVAMDAVLSSSWYERAGPWDTFLGCVDRCLAVAELKAPTAVQGAFINAGNSFDAMAAIGKVLGQAKVSARIVDPYMDEKALTDFAGLAKSHVQIDLLADEGSAKPSLKPAVQRWKQQYQGDRPLEARLAKHRTLHDRLIIIDSLEVWTLTQSLNAFAARSPASIVRIDAETAALKVPAYDAFWEEAGLVV